MDLFNNIVVFIIWYSQLWTYVTARHREGRITGGDIAEPHSHPYIVSLQSRFLWTRYRVCSGSIVSRRWILSAGHCVADYSAKWLPMDAIIGAHNLKKISYDQIYPIYRRIAHPYYKGGVGPYDIAMLKTEREIQYSDTVQPIMLPTTSPMYMRNEKFTITGWGALEASPFLIVLPNKLREAEVPYLPYYDCYKAVDHIKDYYERNPLVREFNICTGPLSGGLAGCSGDSGGPLIQYIVDPEIDVGETTLITTEEYTTTEELTTTTIKKPTSTTKKPTTTTKKPTTTTKKPTTTTKQPTTTTKKPTTTTKKPTTTTKKPTTTTKKPMPMTTDRPTSTTTLPTTDLLTTIELELNSTLLEETTTPTMETDIDMMETTTDEMEITLGELELTTDETSEEFETTTEAYYTTEPTVTLPDLDLGGEETHFKGYATQKVGVSDNSRMIPVIVGVMSWGVVPCGLKGAPTVYSNVTKYMDFINQYKHEYS